MLSIWEPVEVFDPRSLLAINAEREERDELIARKTVHQEVQEERSVRAFTLKGAIRAAVAAGTI